MGEMEAAKPSLPLSRARQRRGSSPPGGGFKDPGAASLTAWHGERKGRSLLAPDTTAGKLRAALTLFTNRCGQDQGEQSQEHRRRPQTKVLPGGAVSVSRGELQ